MNHWFKAGPLSLREWDSIEDFRREVEKREKKNMTNKDLILWVVGHASG